MARSKLVECLRGLVTRSTALEHDLHTPLRLASESVSRATDVAVQVRRTPHECQDLDRIANLANRSS